MSAQWIFYGFDRMTELMDSRFWLESLSISEDIYDHNFYCECIYLLVSIINLYSLLYELER